MKKLLLILLVHIGTMGFAQQVTGTLVNPLKKMKPMDIAVWPLGLDKSVSIGQLKEDGTLEFDFPPMESFQSDDDTKQMVVNELKYSLAFSCLGQPEASYPEVLSARIKPITLWHKDRYAGVLFPVTSEALIPWLEDEAYNNPVKGTFYELIFVAESTIVQMQCTNTNQFSGNVVEATYVYNLELEAGLNFVAYTLEEIYETDPTVTSFKPSKVTVRNIREGLDDIQWIAKYF